MAPQIHIPHRILPQQIRLVSKHVIYSPTVVVAESLPGSRRQRHRRTPFLFPAPCRSNQHASRSVRKRQCDLRFPIRNAPGIAPSAAWRRKVLGGMPSASAASVKPIDRRLSSGERIICPPSFRTLVPCIRGPFRQ